MFIATLMPCRSFNHANILRHLIVSRGYAAVAASVVNDGEEHHVCLAHAPNGVADEFAIPAVMYSLLPGDEGMAGAKRISGNTPPSRGALTPEQADLAHNALVIIVKAGADRVNRIAYVNVDAAPSAAPQYTTDHDPGDEDTKPVRNPLGGGWENRCHDEYDDWKSQR